MKDKMILELYLPAAEKSYDVKVPRQMKVAHVTGLLIDFLSKKDSEFIPTKECVLCDATDGRILTGNTFIEEAGLQNGSRVMLL